MKKLFITCLLTVSFFGYSQNNTENGKPSEELDNSLYNTAGVDVKPEFPGGIDEFYSFVSKNFNIPKVQGLAGKIFVSFVIDKDGTVGDIKIIKDIGHGTAEEVIRMLSNCPKWIPGEQNGQKVRVLYALPISIVAQK